MRPDAASPALVVLQLLARADELAAAAAVAIRAGNDPALFAILDDRSSAIDAAIRTWRTVSPADRSPALVAKVEAAARSAVHAGLETREMAVRARDQAVSELSALEARQHASNEYEQHADGSRGSINVVL